MHSFSSNFLLFCNYYESVFFLCFTLRVAVLVPYIYIYLLSITFNPLLSDGRLVGYHGCVLDDHGRDLDDHGRVLDDHGRVLSEHGCALNDHGCVFIVFVIFPVLYIYNVQFNHIFSPRTSLLHLING